MKPVANNTSLMCCEHFGSVTFNKKKEYLEGKTMCFITSLPGYVKALIDLNNW